MLRHAVVLAAILSMPSLSLARTWHILPDGTGDAPTIHAGISVSQPGDTLEIACGTYYEHDIPLSSTRHITSATGDPACVTIDAEGHGRVFHCTGTANTSSLVGLTLTGGATSLGGGMRIDRSPLQVSDCLFLGNAASSEGGGLYAWYAAPVVRRCEFRANTSTVSGGAVACQGGATPPDPAFLDTVFQGNIAQRGGAIYTTEVNPVLSGCRVVDNEASSGGGLWCYKSAPVFVGCTVSLNTAYVSGGGIWCEHESSASLETTILWGNFAGAGGAEVFLNDWFDGSCAVDFMCCDVDSSGIGGLGTVTWLPPNVFTDPLFCASTQGDFHLRSDSPCAPVNSTVCGLIGSLPVGCGPVSIEPLSWGKVKGGYR